MREKLPESIAELHKKLYQPPPKVVTLVPTSEQEAQTWKYTTDAPPGDWMRPAFDDARWKQGPGGFGTANTPGTVVRTEWKTNDIWLRRTIELPADKLHEPALRLHHDEDVEIYLDGEKIGAAQGYTTSYQLFPLDAKSASLLKPGKHVLAVHCKQTGGGQYVDVGIVDLVPAHP